MALCLLVSLRFQVLFHSPPGVLFTFPSRYSSLSVTWSYLAFWDGPHFFRPDFSCPDVLWIPLALSKFRLRGFHPLCLTFPGNSTTHPDAISRSLPRIYYYIRFGLLRFRSPLLSESFLLSFPPGIEMFQFPGFPSVTYGFSNGSYDITRMEFPHSDICASQDICSSAQLFAACHVLLRRHVPQASSVCSL